MNEQDKKIRAINFDLDTSKLKELYPKRNWRNAYNDIRKFMQENNFKHRQGSGYVSKEPLGDADSANIIRKLGATFPWIAECINHLDVTSVLPTIYDSVSLTYEGSVLYKSLNKTIPENTTQKTLSQQLNKAEQKKNEINSQKSKSVHKNKDNLTL